MNIWNHITVLSIEHLYLVSSVRGNDCTIVDRHTYGLSFSYGGQISYHWNGMRFVSHADNAVLLPKGQTYDLKREETGRFPVINFTCTEDLAPTGFVITPLRHPESYLRDFERMRALWLLQKNPAQAMSILYGILARLSEEATETDADEILSPALAYMIDHISDPALSNAILAKQAHISEVYFRKRFKEQYGSTPHQYLLALRMRHAKALLAEHAVTITSVAEACGFSSVYHFCRAFKQFTGQTPTEFAQANPRLLLP